MLVTDETEYEDHTTAIHALINGYINTKIADTVGPVQAALLAEQQHTADLTAQVATLQAEIVTNTTVIAGLVAERDSLTGQVTALTAQVADLQEQIGALNAYGDVLEAEIIRLTELSTGLQNQVTVLEARIVDLEAQIAELTKPSHDWSDDNPPWAYTDPAVLTERWPAGVTVVDIQTASTDFWTNLQNTCDAAAGRIVVRLGEGVHSLKSFRMIGSSGDPTYAFGFWHPNLRGFLGQGTDKTVVQMDPNSLSQAQLDKMATMRMDEFQPLQLAMARLDGSATSPILLAGVTFRGCDQQPLTAKGSDVSAVIPQPAPYGGIVLYREAHAIVSYVRYQAAGHACTSAPPFESGNSSIQYGSSTWNNCEFDGRLAAEINPARPRRQGVWMGNNETLAEHEDCWFHHSNVSRYAVNDQNRDTSGVYSLIRCKANDITNTNNDGMGGVTNASLFGWESVNGTINVTDCIMSQDNYRTNGQIAQHLQLTSVGSRNPQGGRLNVRGGEFRNTGFPALDGFLCIRAISSTYWVTDGYATTMDIRDTADGPQKAPYVVTGTWPPTAATLDAAGITPETHYIVRNS